MIREFYFSWRPYFVMSCLFLACAVNAQAPVTLATLDQPILFAVDGTGNLFSLTESGNYPYPSTYAIAKITPSGAVISVVNPLITQYRPNSMALDFNGNFYIREGNGDVNKIAPDGTITPVNISDAIKIVCDSQGNLLVLQYYSADNFMVKKITPSGSVSTVIGPGIINTSEDFCVDGNGNVYVVNYNVTTTVYSILKISADGNHTIIAGNGILNSLRRTTCDAAGNLFVVTTTDNIDFSISKLSVQGNYTTLFSEGLPDYNSPSSIVVDAAGAVFLSYQQQGTILKFTAAGSTPNTTQIRASQCGVTLAALNTDVMADFFLGATDYRFKVVANGATEIIERGNRRYFNLTALTTINAAYNTSYTISVSVKKNGVWGSFGTECIVATPLPPVTKVKAVQCGATLAALNTDVQADWLQFATAYRFKVVGNGNTELIDKTYRYFNLTALTAGATYNTAYTISVAVQHNGAWGDFGTECVVTTPQTPPTKVRSTQCGATLAALNTDILADWLQFATAYRFKVMVNGASYIVNPIGNRRYFKLTALPISVTASNTYTISVAAKFNGVWSDYATECEVTTPSNSSNVRQIVETTDFGLVAYPNPSNCAFNLQINGSNNENVSVLVFDMTGRQIENKVLDATAIENITLGQNYSAGIYNVIVSQGMNTRTVRLVKN